jgi:hypothetical protein
MKLLKQAFGVLGALVVLAVIVALVAPKKARAMQALLVQITNTAANPVPMLDVDNPAHQPASLVLELDGAASTSITAPSSLPSGGAYRELVINWVTGACFAPAGNSAVLTISLQTDGSQLSFFPATESSGSTITFFGSTTSLYASPSSTVSLGVLNGAGVQIDLTTKTVSSTGANAFCLINADGYYVTE